ncbi:twitching motility protein PilT [Planctomycetales bacterium]|nr:twitching motility protein PilT [Planctomycetales bacterium]GHS98799.1 twitching motility protein PilT [Planctomycetales bacterium]GHT06559.1 twitching motility protein PilT [Planctomycetales bacterium]
MNAPFFDTNILVYYFAGDESEKQRRARQLLYTERGFTGLNNLNEMVWVLFRKKILPPAQLILAIDEMERALRVITPTIQHQRDAVRVMLRYGFSYYDSLVIAAALAQKCQKLYSEDLQNGQVIDGVLTVVNPFG